MRMSIEIIVALALIFIFAYLLFANGYYDAEIEPPQCLSENVGELKDEIWTVGAEMCVQESTKEEILKEVRK